MLILASTSARRRAMLDMTKVEYTALDPKVDECVEETIPAFEKVKILSARKADAIAKTHQNDIVIGSDTVVFSEGKILEKPKDREDAYQMLRSLSNKTHSVFSGIAVIKGEKCISKTVKTDVTFRELSDREIYSYIDKFKPFDKAGAYGIQEMGGLFVEKIDGDMNTVIGMPLTELYLILRDEFEFDLFCHDGK